MYVLHHPVKLYYHQIHGQREISKCPFWPKKFLARDMVKSNNISKYDGSFDNKVHHIRFDRSC